MNVLQTTVLLSALFTIGSVQQEAWAFQHKDRDPLRTMSMGMQNMLLSPSNYPGAKDTPGIRNVGSNDLKPIPYTGHGSPTLLPAPIKPFGREVAPEPLPARDHRNDAGR